MINFRRILKKFFCALFFIFILNTAYADKLAQAEPPHAEYVPVKEYTRNPHVQQQPSSDLNSIVDSVLDIILSEGLSGAIIIILFAWTFRVDKANRAEQKENTNKFETLSKECSQHMAAVSVKMENLEREVEQFKQLQILRKS